MKRRGEGWFVGRGEVKTLLVILKRNTSICSKQRQIEERMINKKLFADGEMGNGPRSIMDCGCGMYYN